MREDHRKKVILVSSSVHHRGKVLLLTSESLYQLKLTSTPYLLVKLAQTFILHMHADLSLVNQHLLESL